VNGTVQQKKRVKPYSVGSFQKLIYDHYGKHARSLPWRKTRNPYHILVSEIMLQQTQVDRGAIPDPEASEFRKAWARLIQKIYEVDPLTCPKCKGAMKIISFIDQPEVIKAILQHIGLWVFEKAPPPKTKAPPSEYYADDQIPVYDYAYPDYPFEAYL
jgi:hypothetical protein